MESPATAATAGVYCQQCGYDLRASGEAKRCPECGRVFAPGDPKSFRPRPFAAPWKRALGRWAKRAAILLLALAVLLGGAWGWYYWGWYEEQAALAELGDKATWCSDPADPPATWLNAWGIPGGFAFARIDYLRLDATATDADLRPLRKLSKLGVLEVDGPITDAGLVHLEKLRRLRFLELVKTRVTPAGVAKLQAALPHCMIEGP